LWPSLYREGTGLIVCQKGRNSSREKKKMAEEEEEMKVEVVNLQFGFWI
jgi:hypothetical protein